MASCENYLNCECPICGKWFHLKPSAVRKAKNHYCSKKCHYEAKKTYMSGEGNHQFGIKGKENATWKSDKRLSRYGYIQVRVLDHPFRDYEDFVFEHRLVAEQYLLDEKNSVEINGKRYLADGYVVHHKNFHRTDNRVENLAVMTKTEHSKLHTKLNPREKDARNGRFLNDTEFVRIKRVTETARMPERKSNGAAGFDLYVDSAKEIVIAPHSTVMIGSGIAVEIPKMHAGLIFARSGISTKEGLRPATCVSVIDSDYRGEIGLPMHNDTDYERVIHPYERVAQMIVSPVVIPKLILVDNLDETERGSNGFGSSGR